MSPYPQDNTPKPKHFGLIWCTDHDWSAYQQALLDTFSAPGEQWTVIDAPAGDLQQDWLALDGFLIGGSEHSVNDSRLPWLSDAVDLLTRAAQQRTPVVGICFGAQLLAHALGGTIRKNPTGQFTFMVESIDLQPVLAQWFERNQHARPMLLQSHGDCIWTLPPEAEHLADSDTARHEIFTIGSTMVGVQGHPEISTRLALEEVMPVHCQAGVINDDQARQSESQLRQSRPQIDGTVALCRDVLTGHHRQWQSASA